MLDASTLLLFLGTSALLLAFHGSRLLDRAGGLIYVALGSRRGLERGAASRQQQLSASLKRGTEAGLGRSRV